VDGFKDTWGLHLPSLALQFGLKASSSFFILKSNPSCLPLAELRFEAFSGYAVFGLMEITCSIRF
jgi:hypothetical protein